MMVDGGVSLAYVVQAVQTEMCFEPSPVCSIYSQCLNVLEKDGDSAESLDQTLGQGERVGDRG